MIGQAISNYEIKSILGEGGMGTVYLAEHNKLSRKVAIKVLLPHLMRNEDVKNRFINEAKLMASLHHPNIVTLYDYNEDGNSLSLIMELVIGKPLDEYIQKVTGPIHEDEAILLMIQALEGFAYAHKIGLIHRDIKPSNLIVTDSKQIKILDFGIAKLVGDLGNKLTKTGSHIGTVYYMSPEQVRGQELDLRSDIYALGITFYQMLTGFCPYEGMTTEFEVFNKIVSEELPDPRTIYPGISEHMCKVIRKATAKKVEDRFQSCEEFIKALKNDGFVVVDEAKATTIKAEAATLGTENISKGEKSLGESKVDKEPTVQKSSTQKQTVPNPTKEEPKEKNNKIIFFIGGGLAVLLTIILFVSMGGNSDSNSNEKPLEEKNETTNNSMGDTLSFTGNSESNTDKSDQSASPKTKKPKDREQSKGNQENPFSGEESYGEAIDPSVEISEAERESPSEYISISYEWNKTLMDDIKIDLRISNDATYVSYSNFELSITYYDKNGGYKGGTTKTINTTLKPGYYLQDQLKMTPPFGVRQIEVELTRVRAIN